MKVFSLLFCVWIATILPMFGSDPSYTIEDYLRSVPVQERSRYHFSNAIESWGLGNLDAAKNHIDQAFLTPMYPQDIAKIWYFLAKLYIESGEARQAVESLNNVLLIEPDRTEILILLRTLRSFFEDPAIDNPIIGLEYHRDIQGYQNSFEIFYNPVATEIFQEKFYILDRANASILVVHGQEQRIHLIDMPSPSAMAIDRFSGRLYISDIEMGVIQAFDANTLEPLHSFSGFFRPFIQAVDRIGNLYVLDPPKNMVQVISSEGKLVRNLFLSEGYHVRVVNQVRVSPKYIVFQDLSLRAYRVFRYPSFEEERLIPFPNRVLPVVGEIDHDHNLITIGSDGIMRSISLENPELGYKLIDTSMIDLIGMSDLDIVPPLITMTDFHSSSVKSFHLLKQNPNAITLIDGLEVVENQMHISFRVIDRSGREMEIIHPFLRVIDAGGFVPFSPGFISTPVRIWEYDHGRTFFEQELQTLNRNQTNIVFWRYDGYAYVEENVLPSMLAKNVRLFIESNMFLPQSVQRLAHMTGGGIITSDLYPHALRYFQSIPEKMVRYVRYDLLLPFQGIKTATISVQIGGLDYSDSIYYVNYMIPSLKESLIGTVESRAP